MQQSPTPPAVIFHRVDPERRFFLPSGRFTQPNGFVTFVLGTLMACAIYAVAITFRDNPVSDSLLKRGPVPYAIIFFTCWSFWIISIKALKIRAQRLPLSHPLMPADAAFTLSPTTVDSVLMRLHEIVDKPRSFILTNRIELALANLRNMQRIGDVGDTLESQADFDEGYSESGYTIVRALIWAIPVLGFIGTVLGLSESIGHFGGVLEQSTEMTGIKAELKNVTGGLSVAFETTLQGLLGAMLIHLYLTAVKRSEETLLDDCREFTQRQILGRLRMFATSNLEG